MPGSVVPGKGSKLGDQSGLGAREGRQPPGKVVPGRVVPGKVVPGKVVPGRVVPGNVVPGNVVPGNVVPGNVVPGRVVFRLSERHSEGWYRCCLQPRTATATTIIPTREISLRF